MNKKDINYHLFTKNSKIGMDSIKNFSEIDTQSRTDAYTRRKRLITN